MSRVLPVHVQVLFWDVEKELREGIWLELPEAARAGDLLDELARRYPLFAREVPPGQLVLLVGGIAGRDRQRPLTPGDRVVIFPAISGG
ncbi:MAG: MoaD/ThiS family protein [Desulfurispora sp.]|uniref:MoaD/ThiS family protein n=1 Tax=Desulfurispora sp. TaxID=3014275 RepID=UPI00404AF191